MRGGRNFSYLSLKVWRARRLLLLPHSWGREKRGRTAGEEPSQSGVLLKGTAAEQMKPGLGGWSQSANMQRFPSKREADCVLRSDRK